FLHRVLDEEGGAVVNAIAQRHGVRMMTGDRVVEAHAEDGKLVAVSTARGERVETDLLCCGLGFDYNTEFLRDTGVRVNVGVIADEYLRTDDEAIFTAGDVAEATNRLTGDREVMGTWDSATTQGRLAARNMLGEGVPFEEPSVYTSTMFHTKMRVVGRVPTPSDDYSALSITDIGSQTHFKLLFERHALVGAVAIGDMPRRAELLHLIRSG